MDSTEGELERSRSFSVQNQVGTPGWECARGVCDAGSPWVAECQAFIAGKDVIASGVENQNKFADLFPFAGGDREGRKPFITRARYRLTSWPGTTEVIWVTVIARIS